MPIALMTVEPVKHCSVRRIGDSRCIPGLFREEWPLGKQRHSCGSARNCQEATP